MSREVMQMALEALEERYVGALRDKAMDALRAALAEPEQQPFGFFQYSPHLDAWVQNRNGKPGTAFYTHPPQRTEEFVCSTGLCRYRKPLTDEEIDDIWNKYCDEMGDASINDAYDIARAIEQAHGIKQEEA